MEQYLKRTWAEVDLDAIATNYGLIKKSVGDAECMCVVKADAYGHGAVQVAKQLAECGARYFAVSNIEEAIQLRNGGISEGILILGFTPPELADVLYIDDISQTVFSVDGARRLAVAAKGKELKVHIKIDTGMSRLGLIGSVDEIVEQCEEICSVKGLKVEGIFTHFARADEKNDDATGKQFEIFSSVIDRLSEKGINIKYRHCCNSAGVMEYSKYHFNMVRPGIILYGISPFGGDFGTPVMSIKTVVSQIKKIPEGTPVSYGGKYVTDKDTDVAVLSIGYADGFGRLLSGKSDVLINGQRIRIIGNICMDMTMADVTGKNVREGDTAIVLGTDKDERVTADDLASLMGTIPYEVICSVGKRVPRLYIKNRRVVGKTSLLEH